MRDSIDIATARRYLLIKKPIFNSDEICVPIGLSAMLTFQAHSTCYCPPRTISNNDPNATEYGGLCNPIQLPYDIFEA